MYGATWASVGHDCQFPKYATRRESSRATAVVGEGAGVVGTGGVGLGVGDGGGGGPSYTGGQAVASAKQEPDEHPDPEKQVSPHCWLALAQSDPQ